MIELRIRVSLYGEFENAYTETIYVGDQYSHDDIMEAACSFVESRYDDQEAWNEGEVSWTVDY